MEKQEKRMGIFAQKKNEIITDFVENNEM